MRNKKKAQTIAEICQEVETQLSDEIKNCNTEQVLQIIRNRELDTLIECIMQVDEATASAFPQLFRLKQQDKEDMVKLG